MHLSRDQKHKALLLANRLHVRYGRMPLEDAVGDMALALAEAYVVMHGAGILRSCGGANEAEIIEAGEK